MQMATLFLSATMAVCYALPWQARTGSPVRQSVLTRCPAITMCNALPCAAMRVPLLQPPACRSPAASMGILQAVADGDISAVIETGVIATAGVVAAAAARNVLAGDEEEGDSALDEVVSEAASISRDRQRGNVAVEVDLGKDGEPKGVQRLLFKPMMPCSELLLLELRVPLGLVIEERDAGVIEVTGALPGYSRWRHTLRLVSLRCGD
jgi:hypothetical protein